MKRGFSMVEIVLVLAILAILGSVASSVYKPTLESGNSRISAQAYGNALREAEAKAKMMQYDTAWGARIESSNVVIFSGNSYAARVSARDKFVPLKTTTISGPTEIVFAKFTGIPNVTGTTTFSNAYATSTVSISSAGVINF